jgi:hypothetical protein
MTEHDKIIASYVDDSSIGADIECTIYLKKYE